MGATGMLVMMAPGRDGDDGRKDRVRGTTYCETLDGFTMGVGGFFHRCIGSSGARQFVGSDTNAIHAEAAR